MAYFAGNGEKKELDKAQLAERARLKALTEASGGLLSIGKHCSLPSCNQQDFLPVECPKCTKVFCSAHQGFADHGCSYIPEHQVRCASSVSDLSSFS